MNTYCQYTAPTLPTPFISIFTYSRHLSWTEHCKLLLVSCNTDSSEDLRHYFSQRPPIYSLTLLISTSTFTYPRSQQMRCRTLDRLSSTEAIVAPCTAIKSQVLPHIVRSQSDSSFITCNAWPFVTLQ